MAWSDAARAAALQARLLHSKAQPNMKSGDLNWFAKPNVRGMLAKNVKALRGGAKWSTAAEVMQMAKTSTAVRNAVRKGKSFPQPQPYVTSRTSSANHAVRSRQQHQFADDIGGSSSNYRSPYFGGRR